MIDMKQVAPFCISEEIDHRSFDDKKSIILDLNFHNEEHGDWIDGEGWLDELIDLRLELIQGDFRVLYLAWLKAAENALKNGEIGKNTLEPSVPEGLNQLSNAQKVYARYLDIDEAMIAVASQQSNDMQKEEVNIEKWIDKLSATEKCDFLVRLSRQERNLPILFNRRLNEIAAKEQPQNSKNSIKKRKISALIDLTKQ